MKDYICVIGGANLDVCGYPFTPPLANDSTPASIKTTPGGVGRNIAHNLALLNVPVSLVTAIGDDHTGKLLSEACEAVGIDMSRALVCDEPTSTYLCINDEKGDMILACSDMRILERMDEEFFTERLEYINNSAACVVDSNLPEEKLAWLCPRITAPIFAETVSVGKCERLRPALKYFFAIKANLIEAQKLTGKITPEDCAQAFIDEGIKEVYITLGADGVLIRKGDQVLRAGSKVKEIVNTTGAGDTFLAAVMWSFMKGLDIEQTAEAGMRASAICVSSKETVSPMLRESALTD